MRLLTLLLLPLSCLLSAAIGPASSPRTGGDLIPMGYKSITHRMKIELRGPYAGYTLIKGHEGPWDQVAVIASGEWFQAQGGNYTNFFALLPPGVGLPEGATKHNLPEEAIRLVNPLQIEHLAAVTDSTEVVESELAVERGPEGPLMLDLNTRRLDGAGNPATANGISLLAVGGVLLAIVLFVVILLFRRPRPDWEQA